MPLEQELKLVVNDGAAIELSSLVLPSHTIEGNIKAMRLVSTYFDTAELYLVSQGLGLRMRQSDGVSMQTVKTSGHVQDGLHQREEWEHQLDGAEWDLAKLKQTPLAAIIENTAIWSKIGPVFTTDFERKTLQLCTEDGTRIELAYDRGRVIAGELSQVIHEIELELKAGNVEHLNVLANELQQQLSLSPNDTSKAKMGYQLIS
ncbi:MAG: CYTH domain-containing protein [Pseudomonadota bacterium]|nr:CYTH domain-containing protein [Pseudomonadota bacterium]